MRSITNRGAARNAGDPPPPPRRDSRRLELIAKIIGPLCAVALAAIKAVILLHS